MDAYSPELLKLILESNRMGIWHFDLETQSVRWSDNVKYIFGISSFNGSYDDYVALVHQEDLERVEQAVQDCIASNTAYHIQHRVIGDNDQIKWIEASGKVLHNEEGTPITMLGTVWDVTEHVNLREEIQYSKDQIANSISAAKIGYYDWQLKEQRIFWDQEMQNIHGLISDRAVDIMEYFMQVLHPTDKEQMGQKVTSLLSTDRKVEEFRDEYRVCLPNQTTKYVETAGQVFYDHKGELVRVLGVCIDITEKKISEELIWQEKEKYRSLVQSLGEGIILYNQEGKAVECNHAAAELLKMSPQDIVGRSVIGDYWEAVNEEEEALPKEALPSLYTLATGKPLRNVVIGIKSNCHQEILWLSVNSEPMYREVDGQVSLSRVVLSFIDITEQKNKEKEIIKQNQELKKANQELDNFVYRVSHDLRAPLASSIGLTSLIMQQDLGEEVKEMVELQKISLHKMDQFIQDILHYSRNSRMQVTSQMLDLDGMIQDIVSQLKHLNSDNAVNVSIFNEASMPCYSDVQRIQLILNNLISNTFRYRNPYIAESITQVWISGDEHYFSISVADNGLGIRPQHINRIFDMFYRASNDVPGSGLGLYIVKEAVEKLGGHIFVESEVSKGTAFTVLLPNIKPSSGMLEPQEPLPQMMAN